MDFGAALIHLKVGERMARAGWNGKNMWIRHVPENQWAVMSSIFPEGMEPGAWIGMRTADAKFIPWLASQTDILAEDWVQVEHPAKTKPPAQGVSPAGVDAGIVKGF